jgi:hypothetical protein
MYFESEEGGMATHDISAAQDLSFLYGWMCDACRAEDQELLYWMDSAEVGGYFNHRLGVLVRLKDA